MKNKKGLEPVVAIVIALIIVAVIGGYFVVQKASPREKAADNSERGQITIGTPMMQAEMDEDAMNGEAMEPKSTPTPTVALIEITSSGFSPRIFNIPSGTTVTFLNKDPKPHWPASDVHPSHELYPEPGGCISSKFDACKGIPQDSSFSFTFTKKGSWRYHDHLNPSFTGTIIVE